MNKSTNVDFHLSVEQASNGALLLASWDVRTDKASFKFNVEAAVGDTVGEAIAFMSQLQEALVNDCYSWSDKLGETEITKGR